jgi:DNA-binding transcriptional ArsR family regulator
MHNQVELRSKGLRSMQIANGVDLADVSVSDIAAAIGEPARARILYRLVDGHERTSTELSVVANVGPSTTSVHLDRLRNAHLVTVSVRGKHRFYSLAGPEVARTLEGLSVLAGGRCEATTSSASARLRAARTCYDHLAGTLGVLLHDRMHTLGWLISKSRSERAAYELSAEGTRCFEALGIQVEPLRRLHRRFACPCLDWSERRPHLGGALGAALLQLALTRKWVIQDLDSRALDVTRFGRRELLSRFSLRKKSVFF